MSLGYWMAWDGEKDQWVIPDQDLSGLTDEQVSLLTADVQHAYEKADKRKRAKEEAAAKMQAARDYIADMHRRDIDAISRWCPLPKSIDLAQYWDSPSSRKPLDEDTMLDELVWFNLDDDVCFLPLHKDNHLRHYQSRQHYGAWVMPNACQLGRGYPGNVTSATVPGALSSVPDWELSCA